MRFFYILRLLDSFLHAVFVSAYLVCEKVKDARPWSICLVLDGGGGAFLRSLSRPRLS